MEGSIEEPEERGDSLSAGERGGAEGVTREVYLQLRLVKGAVCPRCYLCNVPCILLYNGYVLTDTHTPPSLAQLHQHTQTLNPNP